MKSVARRNGRLHFNLASTESNDDWLNSSRLLKEGKDEEFKKKDETPMEPRTEEDLARIRRQNKRKK